ncbi:LapA family protein [Actinomadura scrupuli]|uniref:LapA family protein n=1 Tax=Actinomadura scrupuli TaxID=559629 RepID=UPI003D9763F1
MTSAARPPGAGDGAEPAPRPAQGVPPAQGTQPAQPAPAPAQAAPAAQGGTGVRPAPRLEQHRVTGTRIGGIWIASILFAIVLLLLLIFILQNGKSVEISFFGLHGHIPLGVALLLSAVLGVLLVVIPGTARIVQLRIVARRHRGQDAARLSRPAETPRQAPGPGGPAPGAPARPPGA